ncbi:thiaminase II [Sphaerobacter thermophilus]|uniref:Aminopyrimidine aminohydrolase n=1 Tax=Sphaerobacter thermophilus (strain ATCC 49802 / DSM 20745 / KCCM 41009 / NCIMB 13125 / S 6022) TaxID=479434 RepID=D1CAI0_SPHTD|nr:thiaminase II [Sphaerobacter thermophilus]ACZ40823.1 transcriptional activator, TenA family [Sphaerobacter thermophilus DSM 20745]
MDTRFTDELWESITPIYQQILEHPFIKGLTDGSLPAPAFRQYVIQDALYLQDFARSIAAATAKAPKDAWAETLAGHARDTLVVERSLHEGLFKDWGITTEEVFNTPPSPTNLAYTSYLVRVAYREPFEEVIGALLPCYWIYWEVGKQLEEAGSPNPDYQRWIDTYASEEFAVPVREVLAIANEMVADLSDARRARVRRHFVTCSKYEWMFWDAAWRLEDWPVKGKE